MAPTPTNSKRRPTTAQTPAPERYELCWPGKAAAANEARAPLSARLVEMRERSYQSQRGENLVIEGDNLVALKLLADEYRERVRLIYIDPPYNTGNEFEYRDNFRQSRRRYAQQSGQASEADGRHHSAWLNLMYPRLMAARELLRHDGVIVVSIGDEEVHNLRYLLAEVFGDENFLGTLVWQKKRKPSFLRTHLGSMTEYLVCFAKDRRRAPAFTDGTVTDGKKFPFNNAGNPLRVLHFPARSVRFRLPDQIVEPQEMSTPHVLTRLLDACEIRDGRNANAFRLEGEWRYSQATLDAFVREGAEIVISRIPFRPNYVNRTPTPKKCHNLLTLRGTHTPTYEDATQELRALFGEDIVEYPKPTGLIKFLIRAVTAPGDLVLDFFAGSGTTAHAVLDVNAEDGGERKFVVVQLAEPLPHPEFATLAELCRQRILRAIRQADERHHGQTAGHGFRALRVEYD